MKLIGFLIIAACVVLGAATASTAYLPRLDLPDEAFRVNAESFVTLRSGAGVKEPEDILAPPVPLVAAGTELTPAVLSELRAEKVVRVRVREFSFARWSHKWHFLLAVAGLLAGGFLVKTAQKRAIAEGESLAASRPGGTPTQAVGAIIGVIDSLLQDLPGIASEEERLETIIARIDDVQRIHVMTVVDGRSMLVGRLGLGGFAEFMDVFSTMERLLNRAWSAAADGVEAESMLCLNEAAAIKDLVREKLGAS